MENISTIGGRIKVFRKQKRLSQTELGDLCGANRGKVAAWELGRANPPIENIIELVKIFHTSYEYLIEGKGQAANEATNVTENDNEDMPYSVDPLALQIIRDVIVELKENNAHLRKVNEFLMARVKDPETLAELADLTAAKKVG